MPGKTVKMATPTISKTQNGKAPMAASANVTLPWAMPTSTNKFMPTGGVSMPISTIMVITTPSQIASKPRPVINGNTTGKVITIIDRPSKIMPSNR